MASLSPSLIAILLLCRAPAAEYGPICQWHRDPTTTMAITWIEKVVEEARTGSWQSGAGGFGYGDDDDRTLFKDMRGNYRSIYIRSPYELPADLPDDAELVLSMRYDDGFVAYLDGREVARQGVEGSGNTVQQVTSHEADAWKAFPLGKAVAGRTGVIAIEGHNTTIDSSDFTLRPRLEIRAGGRTVPVIREGARWAYLAGAIPEAEWRTRADLPGPANEAATVALYELAHRPAAGGDWTAGRIDSRELGATGMAVHSADLGGLQPGTRHEFRIVRRGEEMGRWEFETAPARFEEGMTFVTGGDMYHSREKLDAMNARAGREDPLFALLGGDLAYGNGLDSDKWLAWVESWHQLAVAPDGRLIPMVVVIGNHEVKGAKFKPLHAPKRDQSPFFYSLFLGQDQGARFALDFGDYLSVIGLDSGHTDDIRRQSGWLATALSAREDVPRLFACYHRPAWGTGVKDNAADIQREWCPLFERHRVDAVFENDHHVYKRTHPIVGNGRIDDEDGILYLGDGSWGVNTRLIPEDWAAKSPYLAEARSLNHLIKVTLTGTGIDYEAMTADGKVFDSTRRPLRR